MQFYTSWKMQVFEIFFSVSYGLDIRDYEYENKIFKFTPTSPHPDLPTQKFTPSTLIKDSCFQLEGKCISKIRKYAKFTKFIYFHDNF